MYEYLQTVYININCIQLLHSLSVLEFRLKIQCSHCEPLGKEPRYLALRAHCLEDKYVWTNLIEQRLDMVRRHKHLTASNVTAVDML